MSVFLSWTDECFKFVAASSNSLLTCIRSVILRPIWTPLKPICWTKGKAGISFCRTKNKRETLKSVRWVQEKMIWLIYPAELKAASVTITIKPEPQSDFFFHPHHSHEELLTSLTVHKKKKRQGLRLVSRSFLIMIQTHHKSDRKSLHETIGSDWYDDIWNRSYPPIGLKCHHNVLKMDFMCKTKHWFYTGTDCLFWRPTNKCMMAKQYFYNWKCMLLVLVAGEICRLWRYHQLWAMSLMENRFLISMWLLHG